MRVIIATGLIAMMLLMIAIIIMIASGSGKSRQTVMAMVCCLATSLIIGSYSVFAFINRLDDLMPTPDGKRSGDEIYEYYFGKPRYNCLSMIDHTDLQASSKGDWLHFKTCQEEFSRIIRQYRFRVTIDTNSNEWFDKPVPDNDWFKPNKLGEGRQKFSFPPQPKPRLIIYTNSDSTEVYMVSYN